MSRLRVLVGFSIVAMVLVMASCASTGVSDMQKAEAHFKLGVSHLNGGNLQPAYVEFQTALQYDHKNKQVHNALGTVYLQLKDYPSAEGEFLIATKLDHSYSDAYNNLCYTYYLMRNWDSAIANCKAALSNPLYVTPEKAYYNLGRTYYRKGDYDEAINAYNEALKRMPGLYLAYYGIALSYNGKRQYGKAADAMTQAIELDPEYKGDKDKAERAFIDRKPGNLDEVADVRDYLDILRY